MSNIYLIRGTISVQVEGDKLTFQITPCAGFLTPDKKKAIAFPSPSETSNIAALVELKDGKTFLCAADGVAPYMSAFVSLAAQSKPVELSLDLSKLDEIKVIGFTFPGPTDYAHGC